MGDLEATIVNKEKYSVISLGMIMSVIGYFRARSTPTEAPYKSKNHT